ncbi:MAG: Uma2 family endonuclease [Selenomonadaceae bacterium]|nr:Uma2 family endonuclease [Selenomonadaceae bacterium]
MKENEQIISWGGDIYGSPDMVVEILSRSTKKRDLTIKKDTYERNVVREYWIIDPYMKAISVYLLRDGKYFLDDEYILFDDKEFDKLTDEEKADVKHEVPVSILDGLKIPLNYIFKWGYK